MKSTSLRSDNARSGTQGSAPMTNPSDPTDDDADDEPVSSVLISGPIESLSGLATAPGIDLVRGSTTDEDRIRTVVAYATEAAIAGLQSSGIEVTVLADPATLQARWDIVQGRVE
jgi:hypothetical protein